SAILNRVTGRRLSPTGRGDGNARGGLGTLALMRHHERSGQITAACAGRNHAPDAAGDGQYRVFFSVALPRQPLTREGFDIRAVRGGWCRHWSRKGAARGIPVCRVVLANGKTAPSCLRE